MLAFVCATETFLRPIRGCPLGEGDLGVSLRSTPSYVPMPLRGGLSAAGNRKEVQ